MTSEELAEEMAKLNLLPRGCEFPIAHLILKYNIVFRVARPRKRTLGNFYHSRRLITVNGDLPPYLFLVVTLHELAHFFAYKNYDAYIKPHGQEWKRYYALLLKHFYDKGTFPKELSSLILREMMSPKAMMSKEKIKLLSQYS
ncbi:MAG: hypothetical protein IJ748_02205 [Bacteroidales bacterium]|nr:hypothetical protein [Bacteroidales bacterium]